MCKLCDGTKINTETGEACSRCVHPFERAGLGKAPFRCVGFYVSKFCAAPGAPVQPGSACDYCGTGIMNVFSILSADGKASKVGCDCVRKTPDKALIAEVKRFKADAAKKERIAKAKAEREAYQFKRAAEVAERVAAAAPVLERLDVLAKGSHPWRSRTAEDMARRIREGMPISEKMSALIERMWTEEHAIKSHVGEIGQHVDLTLTLTMVYYVGAFAIEGTYSYTHLYRWHFRDTNGNDFVWKTSVSPYDTEGMAFKFPDDQDLMERACKCPGVPETLLNVKGTIKKHDRYNGEAQTVLTRCKVTRANEAL